MTNVRELTVYEIESYTVTQEVPLVVSNPTQVVDIQQESYVVPTVDSIEHEHDVLHDENFGVNTGFGGGFGNGNGFGNGQNLGNGLVSGGRGGLGQNLGNGLGQNLGGGRGGLGDGYYW